TSIESSTCNRVTAGRPHGTSPPVVHSPKRSVDSYLLPPRHRTRSYCMKGRCAIPILHESDEAPALVYTRDGLNFKVKTWAWSNPKAHSSCSSPLVLPTGIQYKPRSPALHLREIAVVWRRADPWSRFQRILNPWRNASTSWSAKTAIC